MKIRYITLSCKNNISYTCQPCLGSVEDILKAYRHALSAVSLRGPTHFAPTIHKAATFARDHFNEQKYYILLIITDGWLHSNIIPDTDYHLPGIIDDLNQTIEEVVAASHLALYIVIVGVGDADFTHMDTLCGVDGPLQNEKGLPALQNIVKVSSATIPQYLNIPRCSLSHTLR